MDREFKLGMIIRQALKEDIGKGDITTNCLVAKDKTITARIFSRQDAVICGIEVVKEIFKILDKHSRVRFYCKDGDNVKAGRPIIKVNAKASAILSGERVALNFLSHLSGISTKTNNFVKKIKNCKAKILDTRKTIPGLRELEKYAVKCGGGFNHRFGLWDRVLIKDNHKNLFGGKANIVDLIKIAKSKNKNKKIEVEVENLKEFKGALSAGVDIIMLDNMSLGQIRRAVKLSKKYSKITIPKLEVSGNISLNNVRRIAKAGIDYISIGCLTHSSEAIDMKLQII